MASVLLICRNERVYLWLILLSNEQAVASVLLILVLVIFVSVTFHAPLPTPLPTELGWSNYTGFASIAVMPISLTCASVFSEAIWQRCWAAESPRYGGPANAFCKRTCLSVAWHCRQ